jgi:hypothetical protein
MKISMKMMRGIIGFIGVLFLLTPLTVFATDDLMLMMVPALSGGNRPLKNVITVAKANGKFTDPVAAVNSITDASETNPYLVLIGPGVYTITQTLVMKPYVDIAGSGENITKITGAISGMTPSISAIIIGTAHSVLRSLTVENLGGGISSIALCNEGPQIVADVTAIARGGTGNNMAIFNHTFLDPVMKNVTARAYPGALYSYGVYNNNSSPTMIGVTAEAGGDNSYGVYNMNLSNPQIRHSTMSGFKNGLYSDHSTATVSQSTIKSGAGGPGTNKCVACDNGSGTALGAACN